MFVEVFEFVFFEEICCVNSFFYFFDFFYQIVEKVFFVVNKGLGVIDICKVEVDGLKGVCFVCKEDCDEDYFFVVKKGKKGKKNKVVEGGVVVFGKFSLFFVVMDDCKIFGINFLFGVVDVFVVIEVIKVKFVNWKVNQEVEIKKVGFRSLIFYML